MIRDMSGDERFPDPFGRCSRVGALGWPALPFAQVEVDVAAGISPLESDGCSAAALSSAGDKQPGLSLSSCLHLDLPEALAQWSIRAVDHWVDRWVDQLTMETVDQGLPDPVS